VLVGVTLSNAAMGRHLKGALAISAVKTLLHPALMALAGYAAGLRGMSLTVLVVAASLPIGANVFLFSQRYQKAQDLVTASVAVSTLIALVTVTITMTLVPLLAG
jgi:malonate transporter